MMKNSDIRHGRHCVFNIHVHLVFVTKYRRGVFTKDIIGDLRGIFAGVCADFEAELVECNGEDDHVHLLVNYPREVVGRRPVVTKLFCRKLRRRTDRDHPAVH
jgi:putative transposase